MGVQRYCSKQARKTNAHPGVLQSVQVFQTTLCQFFFKNPLYNYCIQNLDTRKKLPFFLSRGKNSRRNTQKQNFYVNMVLLYQNENQIKLKQSTTNAQANLSTWEQVVRMTNYTFYEKRKRISEEMHHFQVGKEKKSNRQKAPLRRTVFLKPEIIWKTKAQQIL